jgi:hypothetical protein
MRLAMICLCLIVRSAKLLLFDAFGLCSEGMR